MTEPVRIWIASIHHNAFRCGGWAFVRLMEGPLNGFAGGERNTTPRRIALSALSAAFEGLPSGSHISIQTQTANLAGLAQILNRPEGLDNAALGDDGPLWSALVQQTRPFRLGVTLLPDRPNTPAAFAMAWAEQGMEKAKAKGAFSAAIPKPNLIRMPGII